MITVQTAAIILLLLRILSLGLIASVVLRQITLFKLRIDSDLVKFRFILFLLGVAMLVGSVVPIYIDVYYSIIETDASWNGPLVMYATSNTLTHLAGSLLLWKVYQIAGTQAQEQDDQINDSETS